MIKPLVTVVTATTGNKHLYDALLSVKKQTYDNIEHYVVVDGVERKKEALKILKNFPNVKLLVLPYATGIDQYNGHRIYGAATYLSSGKYITFLDEDNYYNNDHIESCVGLANQGYDWVYSFRNIINQQGQFVTEDNCESLGKWKSILNDNFIDVGCWFLSKTAALTVTPLWYRRARHPEEQPEVDRIITSTLMQHFSKFEATKKHSLNYRVGNRADSVQAEFFLKGNETMLQHYNGKLPWQLEEEYVTIPI
jgi:glycosyltransferase involved in cell wall biosynthesis